MLTHEAYQMKKVVIFALNHSKDDALKHFKLLHSLNRISKFFLFVFSKFLIGLIRSKNVKMSFKKRFLFKQTIKAMKL